MAKVSAISEPEPDTDSKMPVEEKQLLKQAQGRVLLFSLGGPMSFGAAKSISQRLSIVEKYDVLILDFSEVPHLGVTAALAIENMINEACNKQHQVFLAGAKGPVRERLRRLKLLDKLPYQNQVSDRLEALQQSLIYLNYIPLNQLSISDEAENKQQITDNTKAYKR